MHTVAHIVATSHGVERNEYRLVHFSADIYLGCLSDNSYHLVVYTVDVYLMPYGCI